MTNKVFPDITSDLSKNYGYEFEVTDEYITLDDDRFIINYGDIYNDLSKFKPTISKDLSLEDFKEIVMSNFKTNTYGIENLNIQDTGEELIIS